MESPRARLAALLIVSMATVSPCTAAPQHQVALNHATVTHEATLRHDSTPLSLLLSDMQWSPPPEAPEAIGLLEYATKLQQDAQRETQGTVRRDFLSRRSELERPLIADVVKRIVLDPTTYAPAAIVYSSLHLDWKSSQPMFNVGYVEAHSGYTKSGLPNDIPVDYAEGRRRNRDLALRLFGRSIANNAASAVVERLLIERAPRHRKLIRVLGWIERTAFASYFSYVLSEQHFAQWKKNEDMARRIGAK